MAGPKKRKLKRLLAIKQLEERNLKALQDIEETNIAEEAINEEVVELELPETLEEVELPKKPLVEKNQKKRGKQRK